MKEDLEEKFLRLDNLELDKLGELIDYVVILRFRWARDVYKLSRPKLVSDDEFIESFGSYAGDKIKEIEGGNFGKSDPSGELLRCILAYSTFFNIPSYRFIDPSLDEYNFKKLVKKKRKEKRKEIEKIGQEVSDIKTSLAKEPERNIESADRFKRYRERN